MPRRKAKHVTSAEFVHRTRAGVKLTLSMHKPLLKAFESYCSDKGTTAQDCLQRFVEYCVKRYEIDKATKLLKAKETK